MKRLVSQKPDHYRTVVSGLEQVPQMSTTLITTLIITCLHLDHYTPYIQSQSRSGRNIKIIIITVYDHAGCHARATDARLVGRLFRYFFLNRYYKENDFIRALIGGVIAKLILYTLLLVQKTLLNGAS